MSSFTSEALNLGRAIVPNPIVVNPDVPLGEVIALMHEARESVFFLDPEVDEDLIQLGEARASCVLVVQDSQLIGIFTAHDVVKVSASGQQPSNLAIHQVVTKQPITLPRSQFYNPLTTLKLLTQHQIHHLPIVDEQQQVVGLVTSSTLQQVLQPTDLLHLQRVADVMITDILQADLRTPLLALARLMVDRQADCIVITDNQTVTTQPDLANKRIFPVGLVTTWDLIEAQKLAIDFAKVQAGAVMRTPVPCLSAEDLLWTASQKMHRAKSKQLAVLGSQGELVGVISEYILLQMIDPIQMRQQLDWHEQQLERLQTEHIELAQQQTVHLTERIKLKQSQLHLQQRKTFYRQLVEEVATGVWLLDTDQKTTFVNHFLLDLLGYAPQDMKGRRLADFYEGEERIEIPREASEVANLPPWEGPLRCQDGSQIWVTLALTPLLDQADRWVNTLVTVTNVDIYHQNATALTLKNQFLEQVFEQTPSPIAVQDHSGYYLLANQAMADLYGLTIADLIGKSEHDVHQDASHLSQHQLQTQRVLDDDRHSNRLEERFLLGNREVWIRWQRQLLPTLDSNLPQMLIVGTDITAHKQTEADLRMLLEGTAVATGEQFFSALVQNLALTLKVEQVMVGQMIGDRLQTFAYWADHQLQENRNDAVENTPHEKLVENSTYCCSHNLKQRFPEAENCLVQPAESYVGIVFKAKTGHPVLGVLCILDSQPIVEPSRHLSILQVFAERSANELERLNATEDLQRANQQLRNRLEEHRAALRETENRAKMAANSLPVPVWMAGKDGQHTFFNQAWLEFTGLSLEDAHGYRWTEFIHPEDSKSWEETFWEAIKVQRTFQVEYRLKRADGEYRWMLDEGRPRIQDGNYLGYIGSCVDITEQKAKDKPTRHMVMRAAKEIAEEKIKQYQAQAAQETRQALQWTRDLLAKEFGDGQRRLITKLHQLKDSLTATKNSASILEERGHCLKEETKQKHLQEIQAATEYIEQLLAEIFIDAETNPNKIEFQPIHFNLEALCREVVNEIKPKHLNHQILLTLELDEHFKQPHRVFNAYADPKMIRQILHHLLSNAIKFSPDGGAINVRLMERAGMIALQVQDEGIGIPLEDQKKGLFQAFRRGQNVGETPGHGLGLAIVKQLVDFHSGRVALTSQPGEGTSCTIFFPIQNSDGFAA